MRFVRWDNWVLWLVVGVVGVIGLLALIPVDEKERPVSPQSKRPRVDARVPTMFADASGGIEQYIGGNSMPTGTYDFKCSSVGSVSVQLGRAPYTVSMKTGDQTRVIGQGDSVTVGWCKVYGPQ